MRKYIDYNKVRISSVYCIQKPGYGEIGGIDFDYKRNGTDYKIQLQLGGWGIFFSVNGEWTNCDHSDEAYRVYGSLKTFAQNYFNTHKETILAIAK
jgi:hypothetical protein